MIMEKRMWLINFLRTIGVYFHNGEIKTFFCNIFTRLTSGKLCPQQNPSWVNAKSVMQVTQSPLHKYDPDFPR